MSCLDLEVPRMPPLPLEKKSPSGCQTVLPHPEHWTFWFLSPTNCFLQAGQDPCPSIRIKTIKNSIHRWLKCKCYITYKQNYICLISWCRDTTAMRWSFCIERAIFFNLTELRKGQCFRQSNKLMATMKLQQCNIFMDYEFDNVA